MGVYKLSGAGEQGQEQRGQEGKGQEEQWQGGKGQEEQGQGAREQVQGDQGSFCEECIVLQTGNVGYLTRT